jgi:hypothetical protein
LYLPISILNTNPLIDCSNQINPEIWCFRTYDSNERIDKYKHFGAFLWIKALSISIDDNIKEIESKQVPDKNFMSTDTSNSRVWYYKNWINKSLFFADWWFISFFNKNNEEKTIDFSN